MKYFVIYLVIFLIIFLFYKLYFYIRTKNKINKKILEEHYLECRHKLKIKEKDKNGLYTNISIINSLILTISYAIFNYGDNLILQILITVITVFVLIFCFYEILGNYYKKR